MKKSAVIFITLGALAFVALLVYPMFQPRDASKESVRQGYRLARAMDRYLKDNRAKFPSGQSSIESWLGKYDIDDRSLSSDTTAPSFNENLYGRNLASLKDLSKTVAFYGLQSEVGTHYVVVFADSKVMLLPIAEMDTVIWNP